MLDNCLNIYIIIYLDNIQIYLIILENYKKYIQKILSKLFNKQLYCKLKKYKFYKTEIISLGFLIRREKIKMDSLKIEKVINWSRS